MLQNEIWQLLWILPTWSSQFVCQGVYLTEPFLFVAQNPCPTSYQLHQEPIMNVVVTITRMATHTKYVTLNSVIMPFIKRSLRRPGVAERRTLNSTAACINTLTNNNFYSFSYYFDLFFSIATTIHTHTAQNGSNWQNFMFFNTLNIISYKSVVIIIMRVYTYILFIYLYSNNYSNKGLTSLSLYKKIFALLFQFAMLIHE